MHTHSPDGWMAPYRHRSSADAENQKHTPWVGLILIFGVFASCTLSEPTIPPTVTPTPLQPVPAAATATRTPAPTPTSSPSNTPTPTVEPPEAGTLRRYADLLDFGIGALFQNRESKEPPFPQIYEQEFNVAMMTTFMKSTQPERDRLDWRIIDATSSTASTDNQKVMAGPLIYNDATAPDWLGFSRPDCGGWKPADLLEIMRQYILSVTTHAGEMVFAWEVVNEPITGSENCWRKTLGDGYIATAFRMAHEYAPHALLFLNEAFGRGGVDLAERDAFFALVDQLESERTPLDAVGIEMHLSANDLRDRYQTEFNDFLDQVDSRGLQTFITEMDVYQGPGGFFPDPMSTQKAIYHDITATCLAHLRCTNLVVWGVSDPFSWLLKIEGGGFSNAQPLLFDSQFSRKPAYYGIADALFEAVLRGRH
jgi:endo-1,4-beta-xylanase